MSWYDRDYVRPGANPWRSFHASRPSMHGVSIVTALIIANSVVFVLCSLMGGPSGPHNSALFRIMALTAPAVLEGQIWRLITANYLHWTFGHILMNMIGLYFLGRPLERDLGPKRFFAVYTLSGLLGSLFYILLTYIGWLTPLGVAAGASGCVLGLLGACAARYPSAEILIYFVIPIRIRTAAMVFGGWYLLNLITRGANAGGDACHLAGMVFGVWWGLWGESWWVHRARRSWFSMPGFARRRQGAAPYAKHYSTQTAERDHDEDLIDRILRKVYEGGIHTLSEQEKQSLREATTRQQERDRKAGRL